MSNKSDFFEPTIKEMIVHELTMEGGPLTSDELARKLRRSRKAILRRLLELKYENRVQKLGRKIGWGLAPVAPTGPVSRKRLPKPT